MTIGRVIVGETRVFIPGYGVGLVTGIRPTRGSGRTFVPGAYYVTLDHDGSIVTRSYYDLLPESADTGERSPPSLQRKEPPA
jgi:hypothetical protein